MYVRHYVRRPSLLWQKSAILSTYDTIEMVFIDSYTGISIVKKVLDHCIALNASNQPKKYPSGRNCAAILEYDFMAGTLRIGPLLYLGSRTQRSTYSTGTPHGLHEAEND
jgi:hypothetical protein